MEITELDNLSQRAMLINLSVGQWTARKMDKRVSREVAQANNVDADVGNYYKSLVDKASLKAISQLVNKARDCHYTMTLPWNDGGTRILPSKLYMDYVREIKDYQREFNVLVADFLTEYPQLREAARASLGSMFNEADYPSPDRLYEKFRFGIDIMPMPSGGDFRVELDPKVVSTIQTSIENRVRKTTNAAVQDVYKRCAEIVSRYVDRLADPKGVFRDTMVMQANEIVDLLPKLNFVDDPELDELGVKMRQALCQYTPSQLRNSETAREETYKAAKDLADQYAEVF